MFSFLRCGSVDQGVFFPQVPPQWCPLLFKLYQCALASPLPWSHSSPQCPPAPVLLSVHTSASISHSWVEKNGLLMYTESNRRGQQLKPYYLQIFNPMLFFLVLTSYSFHFTHRGLHCKFLVMTSNRPHLPPCLPAHRLIIHVFSSPAYLLLPTLTSLKHESKHSWHAC